MLKLTVIFLLSVFVYKIFSGFVVRTVFGLAYSSIKQESKKKKIKTVMVLFNNIIKTTVIIISSIIILDILGFNITPLITGAGIFGLAVSFGSQSIVKDVVSGIFIILENQINVGDYIKIGNYEGKVKEITLRSTYLLDKDKNLIIIPNSQISSIIKYHK